MGSLHVHMEYDCYFRDAYVSLDNASEFVTYLVKLMGRPCIATLTHSHWNTSHHALKVEKKGSVSSEDNSLICLECIFESS